MIDISKMNNELADATPLEIIEWAVKQGNNSIVSTHFGPFEAVVLHTAVAAKKDITVVWADSGYNTRDTYVVAEKLIGSLGLDVKVYTPKITAARWDNAFGGVPDVGEERHTEFTENFKLEPFTRALKEVAPDVWITGVRAEQTEFRKNMEVISQGADGVIKVAPFLHWKEADMQKYLNENNLPNVQNYFDPTKGLSNRECGLHTQL
ncbi:phosphoadenosine phosphosulfate reductase domain-containing protein [Marinomonas colpomeniae]|uniref:Phosphoadenosine phosphosulfate reductase family protein n=1 Tax=Marinomonas colpomeniae TaxID=2774408 RepID=A0ABR8NVI8_9GAMM|nr:phosphoadenosine phosphosulfate reductase family protein [Marinomonas colpomeniae]MBD5770069.1 phosphoadenosine phosphosulfate reductase family protein [Marinomonas colpomeniae]